jgi:DNA polymerase elongation subunit (family B)
MDIEGFRQSDFTEEIVVSSFSFEERDNDCTVTAEGRLAINAWCLNRDSTPTVIRLMNFPVFGVIELPSIVNRRQYRWDERKARAYFDSLRSVMTHNAPVHFIFTNQEKLYYYKNEKRYPVIIVFFRTIEAMKQTSYKVGNRMFVKDIGHVTAKFHEAHNRVNCVRKLLTERDLEYCQWFKINVRRANDYEKVTTLEEEYFGDWRSMTGIDYEESKNWIIHPGVGSFDIETYSNNENSFPDKNDSRDVAYMISYVYQKLGLPDTRKRYLIIMCDSDPVEGYELIKVNNEVELCEALCDVIGETDPEFITGYNINGFDYPYLDARLKRVFGQWKSSCNRIYNEMPKINSVSWESSNYGFNDNTYLKIPGRISIDLLPVVRREHKLHKYDLNTVSNHFLGRGKHDVSAKDMFRIFREQMRAKAVFQAAIKGWVALPYRPNPRDAHEETTNVVQNHYVETFLVNEEIVPGRVIAVPVFKENLSVEVCIEIIDKYRASIAEMTKVSAYGGEDSELVIDLFEKLNVHNALFQVANITGVSPEDLPIRGQQIRVISQVYNMAHREGIVVDKPDLEPEQYGGGFVGEPTPGKYENTICLDFKSLYPSIMMAYNLCHTTFIPPELWSTIPEENCHIFTVVEVDEDDVEQKYEYRFVKKEIREGILPRLLDRLINERNAVKKQMKTCTDKVLKGILNERQKALKVCANSIYGALGVKRGKLPLIAIARVVTFLGRDHINYANKYLEDNHNCTIVYNDTDSTMYQDPTVTNGIEAIRKGIEHEEEISALFPDPLYLEFEKAGTIFCIKKKKYAYWLLDIREFIKDEDGSKIPNPEFGQLQDPSNPKAIMTKGIVLARREASPWHRGVYAEVLDSIMIGKGMQHTLDTIVDGCMQMIRAEVPWNEMVMIKGLGSNYKSESFFMKVFGDELQARGKPARPGDRLEYVVVTSNNPNKNGLLGHKMRLPEEYLEGLKTDYPEHIDVEYYLDNALKNSVEQLWSIGYINELTAYEQVKHRDDYQKVVDQVYNKSKPAQQEMMRNAYASVGNDPYKLYEILLNTNGFKTKTNQARCDNISGRSVFDIRISPTPIKTIVRAYLKDKDLGRDEFLPRVIYSFSPEMYKKYYSEIEF